MKLKQVYLEALEDFDDAPMPGMNNGQVLDLPNSNFSVSIFADEKKLLFTPQHHKSLPNSIKKLIVSLQEYFKVSELDDKGNGIFEMIFDPREAFDEVVLYVKEELSSNKTL